MLIIVASPLAGCSSAAQTQDKSTEPVKFTLETTPAPPVTGKNEIILKLEDQDGHPLTGATVDVSADHTDMTGMTMSGPATNKKVASMPLPQISACREHGKLLCTYEKKDWM